jgi:hypothetical protein
MNEIIKYLESHSNFAINIILDKIFIYSKHDTWYLDIDKNKKIHLYHKTRNFRNKENFHKHSKQSDKPISYIVHYIKKHDKYIEYRKNHIYFSERLEFLFDLRKKE